MSETQTAAPPEGTTSTPAGGAPPAGQTPAAGGASPAGGNWKASLPEELRAAPSLGKYATPADLAKAYVEAETLIGKKGVILPGENATPEDMQRFHQALGVPEKPEGYDLKAPEGIPEGIWNEESAKGFAAKAHEIGLTPKQAKALAEWQAKNVAGAMAKQGLEADGRTWEDTLKAEWGGDYAAKLTQAHRAVKQFGGDPQAMEAFESRAGGAAMVRMFAKIGAALGEDAAAGIGEGATTGGGVDYQAQAQAIVNDPNSPYRNPLHPEHRATVQRVTELFAKASAA